MSPQLIYRLAKDYTNIVGIKDTVDNINHTRKIIAEVKPNMGEFSRNGLYRSFKRKLKDILKMQSLL